MTKEQEYDLRYHLWLQELLFAEAEDERRDNDNERD